MPVIINDFEVVASPPPKQDQAPKKTQMKETVPAPPPRPEDLERILRRFVQRRLRLWAD